MPIDNNTKQSILQVLMNEECSAIELSETLCIDVVDIHEALNDLMREDKVTSEIRRHSFFPESYYSLKI